MIAVTVKLRPLRARDLDRVVALERELFGPSAWTFGMFADELAALGRWYVAAEPVLPDGVGPQELVGYAGLWFDGDVTQIMTIGVDPAYQQNGIGSLLLDALIDRSRELGAEAVLLEVRVDNTAALSMYEKYGFMRIGLRKRYYQPEDIDAYTMRLELPPLPVAAYLSMPDASMPDAADPAGRPAPQDEDIATHVATHTVAPHNDAVRDSVLITAGQLADLTGHLVASDTAKGGASEASEPRFAAPGGRDVVILDVRWALGQTDGHEQYLAAHIPGAVFVDLDTELAAPATPAQGRHPLPPVETLQQAVGRWGVNHASTVVVYDAGGGTSAARAWWLLRWAGHPDVRLLDGGLAAWQRSGRLVASGEEQELAGDFVVSPGAMPTIEADAAAELAASGRLLDARAPERYSGAVEPVDARPGHIPGALSAPTADNLRTDGTFRTDDELRARYADLGVERGIERGGELKVGAEPHAEAGTAPGAAGEPGAAEPWPGVAVYCGSGVTAAHDIVALASIGVTAALYPGSWSQWSADPDRPVATGAEPGA